MGMLDFDGDKYVSIKDMSEFAKKIVKGNGIGPDEELAVAELMQKMDTNEDRSASLEEYLAYHEAAPEPWIPKQMAEFNAADTNGDGKLKYRELALLVFPPNVTALHVKADEDGDGHLSYDEMTADHVLTQFHDLYEMHFLAELGLSIPDILEGPGGLPSPDDIR